MRLPLKGQIVYYNTATNQLPAMVVGVTPDEKGIGAVSVNIKIFTDNPNGLLQYIANVVQGNETGQWQWPDIAIQ